MAYRCLRRVRHNKKKYAPGALIGLGAREAQTLLDLKAVEAAPTASAPLASEVKLAIRGLDWEAYTAEGKPKTDAIAAALQVSKINGKVRDDVWEELVKEDFKAPEKPDATDP